MDNKKVKELIRDLREELIFSLLEDEDIEKIAPFIELTTYPSGTVLFKEGDPGDFVGCVISGKLEVKKQTEFKGKQVIIALLSKGGLFGELSIFDRHSRSATVEAVEETTSLNVGSDSEDAHREQHPCPGKILLKGLVR